MGARRKDPVDDSVDEREGISRDSGVLLLIPERSIADSSKESICVFRRPWQEDR